MNRESSSTMITNSLTNRQNAALQQVEGEPSIIHQSLHSQDERASPLVRVGDGEEGARIKGKGKEDQKAMEYGNDVVSGISKAAAWQRVIELSEEMTDQELHDSLTLDQIWQSDILDDAAADIIKKDRTSSDEDADRGDSAASSEHKATRSDIPLAIAKSCKGPKTSTGEQLEVLSQSAPQLSGDEQSFDFSDVDWRDKSGTDTAAINKSKRLANKLRNKRPKSFSTTTDMSGMESHKPPTLPRQAPAGRIRNLRPRKALHESDTGLGQPRYVSRDNLYDRVPQSEKVADETIRKKIKLKASDLGLSTLKSLGPAALKEAVAKWKEENGHTGVVKSIKVQAVKEKGSESTAHSLVGSSLERKLLASASDAAMVDERSRARSISSEKTVKRSNSATRVHARCPRPNQLLGTQPQDVLKRGANLFGGSIAKAVRKGSLNVSLQGGEQTIDATEPKLPERSVSEDVTTSATDDSTAQTSMHASKVSAAVLISPISPMKRAPDGMRAGLIINCDKTQPVEKKKLAPEGLLFADALEKGLLTAKTPPQKSSVGHRRQRTTKSEIPADDNPNSTKKVPLLKKTKQSPKQPSSGDFAQREAFRGHRAKSLTGDIWNRTPKDAPERKSNPATRPRASSCTNMQKGPMTAESEMMRSLQSPQSDTKQTSIQPQKKRTSSKTKVGKGTKFEELARGQAKRPAEPSDTNRVQSNQPRMTSEKATCITDPILHGRSASLTRNRQSMRSARQPNWSASSPSSHRERNGRSRGRSVGPVEQFRSESAVHQKQMKSRSKSASVYEVYTKESGQTRSYARDTAPRDRLQTTQPVASRSDVGDLLRSPFKAMKGALRRVSTKAKLEPSQLSSAMVVGHASQTIIPPIYRDDVGLAIPTKSACRHDRRRLYDVSTDGADVKAKLGQAGISDEMVEALRRMGLVITDASRDG